LSLARCSEPFITTIAMFKLDSGLATAALPVDARHRVWRKRRDQQWRTVSCGAGSCDSASATSNFSVQ
jgi:hypothetical protein